MNKKFLYLGVLPALFFQLLGAFFYLHVFQGNSIAPIIYSGTKILMVFWPLLWLKTLVSQKIDSPKPNYKKAIQYGIGSGVVILVAILSVYFLFENNFLEYSAVFKEKAASLKILDHYILFSVFLCIFHSGFEEYYWRWFVYKGLRTKLSYSLAVGISSAAFASHHMIIIGSLNGWLIALFGILIACMGAFWCYIYEKTNSIISSWISHFFADLGIMIAGYFMFF